MRARNMDQKIRIAPRPDRELPLARERQRRRDALACRCRDAEAEIARAARAQRGDARLVVNEQRRVHRPRHLRHVVDVARVNDGRVPVSVLGLQRRFDRRVDTAHPHHRNERHHLFFLHKRDDPLSSRRTAGPYSAERARPPRPRAPRHPCPPGRASNAHDRSPCPCRPSGTPLRQDAQSQLHPIGTRPLGASRS
jgi:hypothetical protein